jgi:alkanesulfonate monooxygenase SsuD/methylene tetrahydromethanopterin reductase-like flavin-dependent oxidoreductase (luciferase family)
VRVFGFDLLAYPEHLDHLKLDGELPYPLPKQYFRPELATQNYREHLDAWALMEEVGFDGIGFNEHHTSPYGLMTSPNLMAAAASQRLQRMKILIFMVTCCRSTNPCDWRKSWPCWIASPAAA